MNPETVKLVNAQTLANEAASRFLKSHCPSGVWRTGREYLPAGWQDYESVYRALVALGQTPKPSDVAQILGQSAIKIPWCIGCGYGPTEVVRIAEESPSDNRDPDYICKDCVQQTLAAFSTCSVSKNPTLTCHE